MLRHRPVAFVLAVAAAALTLALVSAGFAAEDEGDGWVTIFDGTSLKGWKINENADTWKLEDGMLVAHGDRSHIFYVGSDRPFQNFELKVDVKAAHHSNGGIYFHTKF